MDNNTEKLSSMMNKIYHMDCLEGLKQLPSESVDLIVTDPPYKLSQSYSQSVDSDNLLAVTSIFPVALELKRVLKKGRFAAVIYDNRILPVVLSAFQSSGWKYFRTLTFYRKAGTAHMVNGWMSTSDLIIIFQNGSEQAKYFGECHHDVYTKDKLEEISYNHPAQKPLWLIKALIQRLSQEGEIVCDPYMGSGTTGVACKELKRAYIGFEKEMEYIMVAENRLVTSQGEKQEELTIH